MFQVLRLVAVFSFVMAVVGCSIREGSIAVRHEWQKIAEVKGEDVYRTDGCGGNSFSFIVYRGGKVSFNDALIAKKTIVADGPGLNIVTIEYDSSLADPHLDFLDNKGQIYESWCLKGVCLPKAPRMPNTGLFVRLVKDDQIMLATE